MKKKLFITSIFILVLNLNAFTQKFYTIEQVKDTLTKYPNAFEAFSKLEIYKIPIDSFRQDSFLMQKAYDLLDKNCFGEYVFLRNSTEYLEDLKKIKWKRQYYIKEYLKNVRKIAINKLDYYCDSIEQNPVLVKSYIDTLYNIRRRKDSLRYVNQKFEWEISPYVIFHSRLMTQRSYDTIRAYYDRYYQNFNEDAYFGDRRNDDDVIIALINMGDPELRAKYDKWFDEKVANFQFDKPALYFLDKLSGSYKYRKYAKLMSYKKLIHVLDVNITMRSEIVEDNYPYSIKGKYSRDSLLGIYYLKTRQKDYDDNFLQPFEVIAEGFLLYADSIEKKEQILFNKIKYKISDK